jgi:flagellar biogenesis protein FliO
MRDLLVPILGEGWAVVAQFLLTIVIVLGLIGAVWWVVRRYSGVHFGGIGRGRVPRLAIVDVMAVDRRRRLVLVRRDNVEHLLLIGGPADLVVEGTIQRTRQRNVQQAAQAAAQRAPMQPAIETAPPSAPNAPLLAGADRLPVNAPIPFPVARTPHPQAASANGRSVLRSVRPPETIAEPEPAAAPAATFVEPQRPTQLQPMSSRPVAAAAPPHEEPQEPVGSAPEEPAPHPFFAEVMTAEGAPPLTATLEEAAASPPATFADAEREAAEEAGQSALDLGDLGDDMEAPATAAGQPETVAPESTARVSDLEREMARLLDEITTRRST